MYIMRMFIPLGARFLVHLFLLTRRKAAPLFIKSTVTAIIFHARSCYLYDSNSGESRGFSVRKGRLVLLKMKIMLRLFF